MLPRSQFARGVSVLVGGTVGGHILTVLSAPVLTRLYRPEDFGLLAVFVALFSIVGAIASLRYQAAIALPDNDKEADALLLLSLIVVLVVSGLTAIPVILFPKEIAQLLNTPSLAGHLYLLPAAIVFIGVYQTLNVFAIRNKAFIPIARTKITQTVTTLGIQLAGAKFGVLALMIGQVAGHATGAVSLTSQILNGRWHQLAHVKMPAIYKVAYRYKYFPLCGTLTALFNTVGAQIPSILFAALFSPAAAGIYILANRVLSVPMLLLGQATSDVFYSRAAEISREGKLGPLTALIHSRLTHIAMPPTLVLIVGGPEIFTWVFGPAWQEAGVFARWLGPCLYLELLTLPAISIFAVVDKLGTRLMFESVSLVIGLVAIIAGAYTGDILTGVAFLAIGSMVYRTSMLTYLARISGNKWSEIWRPPLMALLWSIPLVSPIILIKILNMDRTFWLLAFGTTIVFIVTRYVCLMKLVWK